MEFENPTCVKEMTNMRYGVIMMVIRWWHSWLFGIYDAEELKFVFVCSGNWVQWKFLFVQWKLGGHCFVLSVSECFFFIQLVYVFFIDLLCVVQNTFPLQIKRRNGLIESGLLIIIEIIQIFVHINQKLCRKHCTKKN